MFNETAHYYDLIYSFKNYENESQQIRDLILAEHPHASSILDVACGTAEHAKFLSKTYKIDGIDLQPEFIEIAQRKVPSGVFQVADMSDFRLDKRYDIVLCLFSSIGYLKEPKLIVNALRCFNEHLNPKGFIIVEPWITPENWKVGVPSILTVDQPDLKICRMNTSARVGTISQINFHYLVGKPEGVTHLTENHELALYTKEEMHSFFGQAGLHVRYDPNGIFSRGMYIANAKE